MNRDPGRGRGRGRDLGRGRGRDRGRGPWRSPGGGAHWVPKGRSSDPSSHSSYSVGPDESSSGEKPFSDRDRNSQPKSRRWFPSYPNSAGNIFCQDESSSGEKPFSNRDRNSQPKSRRWFPSYPNSAGNIFCQKEPLENKSLEDSMSSTGRILHDQSAPSCSSLGSNQSDCSVASNSVNKDDSALMPAISGSRDMKSDIVSAPLEKGAKDGAVHLDYSRKLKSTVPLQNQNESHLSFQACANDQLSQEKDPNIVVSAGDSGYSEQQAVVKPCDICLPKTGTTLKLKPDCSVASNSVNKDDSPLMPAISGSRDMKSDIVSAPLEKGAKDGAVHLHFSRKLKSTVPLQNQNESHLSFQACANDQLSQEKDPNIVVSAGDSGYSEQQAVVKPCDICLPKTGTTLKLKPDCSVASNSVNKDDSPLMPAISGSRDMKSDIVSAPLEKGAKDGAVHLHFSRKLKSTVPLQNQNESHLSFQACANDQLSQEKDPNIVVSAGDSGYSEQQAVVKPCDICLPKTGTTLKLKPDCSVASNSVNKDDSPLMPAISGSRDMKSDIVSAPLEKGAKDGAVHLHFFRKLKSTVPLQNQNESHLSFQACANDQLSQEKDPNIVVSAGDSGYSEQQAVVKPCDICLPKTGTTLKLKPDCSVASNSVNKDDSPLMPAISGSRDMKSDIVSAPLEKGAKDGAVHLHFSRKLKSTVPLQNQNESHLSFQACANDQLSQEKDPNIVVSAGDSGYSEQQAVVKPCDICLPKTGTTLKLKPDCSVASNSVNKDDSPLMPAISGSRDMKSDIVSAPLEKGAKDGAVHLHFSRKLKSTVPLQNQNESHLSFQACANDQLSQEKDPNIVVSAGDSGYSEQQAVVKPCDICLPKTGTTLKLKPDCSVASNSVNKDDSPLMPAISGSRDMKSDIVSAPLEKGAKDGAVHLHFSLKG